jgi:hypothetical protein
VLPKRRRRRARYTYVMDAGMMSAAALFWLLEKHKDVGYVVLYIDDSGLVREDCALLVPEVLAAGARGARCDAREQGRGHLSPGGRSGLFELPNSTTRDDQLPRGDRRSRGPRRHPSTGHGILGDDGRTRLAGDATYPTHCDTPRPALRH